LCFYLKKKPAKHRWLIPVILATWDAHIKRIITVGGQPRQEVLKTPISNTTRAKWTEGMVQVTQCMLCKHEALSSNPRPIKGRKKKKNKNKP
jgi:hypothetical protein